MEMMVFQKGVSNITHGQESGVFVTICAPCLLSETGPSEYGLNGARRCFFSPVLSGNYSVDSPFGLQVYVVFYDIFSFLLCQHFFFFKWAFVHSPLF